MQAAEASARASALALPEIPPLYLRLYQPRPALRPDWAILAGDRQGRVRPRARPRSVVHAGGRRQLGRRRRADAVPRLDLGALRRGRRRRRADRPLGSGGRDLRRRQLPARVGRPRRSTRRRSSPTTTPSWYVAEVERWASEVQRGGVGATGGRRKRGGLKARTPPSSARARRRCCSCAGERAELAPGDGHVALVPAGVPATVQAMVVAGNELQDLPYGPDGHPDPLGASEEDCSSTVNYVLYRAGVRPIAEILKDNPLAQDYVNWGAPGPGRWVTIYATDRPTPHVFIAHRRPPAGHQPRRHRRRAQPLRRRPALADPRPHPRPGRTGRCVTRRGCKVPRSCRTARSSYLLIGGGLASANCARWLREEGADGEVLLVGREPDPPYNRPGVLQGLPARRRDPRGDVLSPERVVGGAGHRAAEAHERHQRSISARAPRRCPTRSRSASTRRCSRRARTSVD